MSFGGGSTSDIGDPRSGEATYAGTSSVAGTAEQMGRDVPMLRRLLITMTK